MTSLPVPLPSGFFPTVHVHESVSVGTVIAQKNEKTEEVVNIAKELGVPLLHVKKVLKKNPGDMIAVGDIVAVKNKWFGLKRRAVISMINGIVIRYERGKGNLFVRLGGLGESKEIVSPVDGVIALCDNKQIVLKTDKNVLIGNRGYGDTAEGEVFVLLSSFDNTDPDNANVLYQLDSQATGKVIVGGIFSRELLVKGLGMGVKGFVGLRFADEDVAHLAKRGVPLSLIEGNTAMIQQLIQWKGRRVFLEPGSNSVILLQS